MHNLHTSSKPAVSMGQTVGDTILCIILSQHKNFISVSGVGRHYESTQLQPLPNMHSIIAASLEIYRTVPCKGLAP